MKAELADYILCLSEGLAHTRQASDRPLYQMYLADAAVLPALAERGVDVGELRRRVQDHERLLSNTWPVGDGHKAVSEAWGKFKALLR